MTALGQADHPDRLLAPTQVIDKLRGFKTSEDPREQMVFRCMIHNLFDEYQFFHNYPDKVPCRCLSLCGFHEQSVVMLSFCNRCFACVCACIPVHIRC